ncbi:hypothetical protein PJP07_31335, partial [Mycobacterium kansasii]
IDRNEPKIEGLKDRSQHPRADEIVWAKLDNSGPFGDRDLGVSEILPRLVERRKPEILAKNHGEFCKTTRLIA